MAKTTGYRSHRSQVACRRCQLFGSVFCLSSLGRLCVFMLELCVLVLSQKYRSTHHSLITNLRRLARLMFDVWCRGVVVRLIRLLSCCFIGVLCPPPRCLCVSVVCCVGVLVCWCVCVVVCSCSLYTTFSLLVVLWLHVGCAYVSIYRATNRRMKVRQRSLLDGRQDIECIDAVIIAACRATLSRRACAAIRGGLSVLFWRTNDVEDP